MKPKICFVALHAYPAFVGGWGGGVERQISLMAKAFSSKGYEVSLVTMNEGQENGSIVDGVRIINMCGPFDGIPGVRFFYPRWTSLVLALRKAGADIYYHNTAEYVTGQVSLWCKLNHRKFVYSVASDPDCDPALPKMETWRDKYLYKYGLKNADKIIVQTDVQKKMLKNFYKINSTKIPMPANGPDQYYNIIRNAPLKNNFKILWVGRISEEKRLEWLLEIAEKMPNVIFEIAGKANRNETEYTKTLYSKATHLDNVKMLGMVPHNDMYKLYQDASLLCCTSVYEGFPNTFLEAWSYGTPVVATVNPDNVITTHKMGGVSSSIDAMVSSIKEFMQLVGKWECCSRNARQYFLRYHHQNIVMQRFEKEFKDVVSSN